MWPNINTEKEHKMAADFVIWGEGIELEKKKKKKTSGPTLNPEVTNLSQKFPGHALTHLRSLRSKDSHLCHLGDGDTNILAVLSPWYSRSTPSGEKTE